MDIQIKYSSKVKLYPNDENMNKLKKEIERLNNNYFAIEYKPFSPSPNTLGIYEPKLIVTMNNSSDLNKIEVNLYFAFYYSNDYSSDVERQGDIETIENILINISSVSDGSRKIDSIIEPEIPQIIIKSKYPTGINQYRTSHSFDDDEKNEIRNFIINTLHLHDGNRDTKAFVSLDYSFESFLSLKDACSLFNKAESTLKTNIKNGKFKEGVDCKKFGTTWVFNILALEREYGEIK